MSLVTSLLLTALCLGPAGDEPAIEALDHPWTPNEFLLALEYPKGRGPALWAARDLVLEPLRTDRGGPLELEPMRKLFTRDGELDLRSTGRSYKGRGYLLLSGTRPVDGSRSIERVAGTFQLLAGGEAHWIDLPADGPFEERPWDDPALRQAGFDLRVRIDRRPVLLLHGKDSDGLLRGVELMMEMRNKERREERTWHDGTGVHSLVTLPLEDPEHPPASVPVRLLLTDGSAIELAEVPLSERPKAVRDRALRSVGIELEASYVQQLVLKAQGTGDHHLLLGFERVRPDGRIEPRGSSGPGKISWKGEKLAVSCELEPPTRKSRLALGVAVGATWSDVSFVASDVPLP